MSSRIPVALLVPLCLSACGSPGPVSPTALATVPPASMRLPTQTLPVAAPRPAHLDRYRHIGVHGVASRVTAGDFVCDPAWPHVCQGFMLTVPSDGFLDVAMTWTPVADPYPLDFDVYDLEGGVSFYSSEMVQGRRDVKGVPVSAGHTYPISIWSAWVPGEPFELQFELQPR